MATDTSTTNFVPAGYTAVRPLGIGTVFAVAVVHDVRGRELICKRAARPDIPETALALGREAAVLGKLQGRDVPRLVASGHDARGGFLVESLAPGVPLRALVDRTIRLPPVEVLALGCAAASALARLHDATDEQSALGFVHGDISPDNVFYAAPSTITFVDFSSAIFRDAPSPALPDDRGTAPYAAPEVMRQETHPTAASDTYALAATLLAVAIGAPIVRAQNDAGRLFEAASQGVMRHLLDERPDLDPAFRSAIVEALQYEQDRRLSSSRALAARLSPLSNHEPHRHE
jgi:serine/threonine protein kinase